MCGPRCSRYLKSILPTAVAETDGWMDECAAHVTRPGGQSHLGSVTPLLHCPSTPISKSADCRFCPSIPHGGRATTIFVQLSPSPIFERERPPFLEITSDRPPPPSHIPDRPRHGSFEDLGCSATRRRPTSAPPFLLGSSAMVLRIDSKSRRRRQQQQRRPRPPRVVAV